MLNTNYNTLNSDLDTHSHNVATTSANGFMSSGDKKNLNNMFSIYNGKNYFSSGLTNLASINGTTEETVTIPNITSYTWLMINFSNASHEGSVSGTILIRVDAFRISSFPTEHAYAYDSNGTVGIVHFLVKYVSDTKIYVTMSDTYRGIYIYGIK